jgi:hypothetical protein
MTEKAIGRALDSLTNAAKVDWDALEKSAEDDDVRETLRALRDIAAIARAHEAGARNLRTMPFAWGPLEARGYIARGAHGDVYRAWDRRLEREVALKLLRSEPGLDPASAFAINEGRLLARIRHPNVVAVYGADRIDGEAGVWMELVEGATLRDVVARDGPMLADGAVRIGLAICDGLAAIHAAGLVHRDIKAQNVVLDLAGRTILMDLSAGQDRSASELSLEGTPLYLAPEILEGRRATIASDTYALGILLFFLLTGRYPVAAQSIEELRAIHRLDRAERLSTDVRIPGALAAVVDRATSRDPAQRFQSAAEFRAALDGALVSQATRKSLRGFAIAAGLTALVVAGVTLTSLVSSQRNGKARGASTSTMPPGVEKRIPLPHYRMGVPSRDGRFFPYVDDAGNLNLWEVQTGRSQHLHDAGPSSGRGTSAVMSPHGEQVVYGWRLPDGAFELRVINADATWPQVIVPRVSAYEPLPLDWSSDGQRILCAFQQQTGTVDLVLVPSTGGKVQLLHSFDDGRALHASLSPDAAFVVVSSGLDIVPTRDVQILDTRGGSVRTLLHPARNERLARWTPRGSRVFFLRDAVDHSGVFDGWVVDVTRGAAVGDPAMVAPGLGGVHDVALTESGQMYRTAAKGTADVYTATFDVSGSSPPGPPKRVATKDIGNHVAPAWSPDGRTLAYFTTADSPHVGTVPRRTLTLQEVLSGEGRLVPVPLAVVGGYTPRWSADGKHVAIWGADQEAEERAGWYRVNVQSAETRPLVVGRGAVPGQGQYSPDGTRFFYRHRQRGLIARELESGVEQLVLPEAVASIDRFQISPDGASLAFSGHEKTSNGDLTTISVQRFGGTRRELLRRRAPVWVDLQGWTRDSDSLLYAEGVGNAQPYRLRRLPVRGGESVDMHFSVLRTVNTVDLSPDSSRIAYTERMDQMELVITAFPLQANSSRP